MGVEHPARLTIDLGAVQENYRRLRARAPGSEVAAVVKADAYGLGAAEVAPALWHAGARWFFVAHLEEALVLRGWLPSEARILVLNGPGPTDSDGHRVWLECDLIPVLNHPGDLASLAALAASSGRNPKVALHIDTGMTRLGFSARELAGIDPGHLSAVDLQLVLSHLAIAEEPDHPLNEMQRSRFEVARRRFPGVRSSLANSSGLFRSAAYHLDLCRPGVALYGVNPTPGFANPMAPVVHLEAQVIQVHDIDSSGTVGYGGTFATRPGMRIATIPVGYADGFPRSAETARARIGNHDVPLAGRISMDLITLDVSALPAGEVRPGTPVDLIWGAAGIDTLAAAAGTIGYEILTRLGSRFVRRYTAPVASTEAV